jgi:hypothetical protein
VTWYKTYNDVDRFQTFIHQPNILLEWQTFCAGHSSPKSAVHSDNTLRGLGLAFIQYLFKDAVCIFDHCSSKCLYVYELKKEGIWNEEVVDHFFFKCWDLFGVVAEFEPDVPQIWVKSCEAFTSTFSMII